MAFGLTCAHDPEHVLPIFGEPGDVHPLPFLCTAANASANDKIAPLY
ncbi:hypothetical protein [Saccharopolyspora endophytica]|uniref:Uncharacterized protein n=1 Tax=Saccharopolyspora endophytica TaxID=543886 RepID=A0ABS5D8G3_9PSEU|nr:hypothetical protein [Saccharopolyspora endophytica]MBQ0922579.1 hypothetical protein [Saccharopolyspora endophytica]